MPPDFRPAPGTLLRDVAAGAMLVAGVAGLLVVAFRHSLDTGLMVLSTLILLTGLALGYRR